MCNGTTSIKNLPVTPVAPSSRATGTFMAADYTKLRRTCTEPDHISRCPLPTHDLRNGRLNQTAYALYLFIRDIADGDLIGWIDQRLQAANSPAGPDRLARMRDAVIAPLREIHGVSDKVLTMALSSLLLGAPSKLRLWPEVGASMIAIDTLVHNFLHRTGILRRFGAAHAYGAACYRPGGCADDHSSRGPADRRPGLQSGVPGGVSAVRAARDLAVLRPERARCLQRQPHR